MRPSCVSRALFALFLSALLFAFAPPPATAASLTLTVSPATQLRDAGGTNTFVGTIINDTGADLDTGDVFLNFAAFDATYATLDQILAPGVVIPDGGTSALLPLFTFSLAPGAPYQDFFAEVTAQTANIFSEGIRVGVLVPAPGAAAGFGAALLLAALRRRASVAGGRS